MKKNLFFIFSLCLFIFSCNHGQNAGKQKEEEKPEEKPEIQVYDHLTEIAVFAGRNNGVETRQEFEKEELASILKGNTKEIEVLGVVSYVYFLSETVKFKSVKINNQGVKINNDINGYKSIAGYVVSLVDTENATLSFVIEADGKTSKGKLKLIRKKELSDVPELYLFMNNKQIRTDGDVVADLAKDNFVKVDKILESDGSVNIQICSLLPFIKEVKINGGEAITPVVKAIGNNRFSVAEHKEIITQTKKFEVEIITNKPELFQNVKWNFTIVKD